MSMKKFIEEVCRKAGPRPPGSDAEVKAARLLAGRLESWGIQASLERFSVAPASLHVLLLLLFLGFSAALGLYRICPVSSFAVMIGLLAVYRLHVVKGSGLFLKLLPTRQTFNVTGRIEPKEDRRRILVLGAHHDSAFRMPILARETFRFLFLLLGVFLAGFVLLIGLSAWKTVLWITTTGVAGSQAGAAPAESVLFAICVAGAAAGFLLVAFLIRFDPVMGANDNLAGVAVAFGAARKLAENPPRHLEVRIASFGGEEAGLVGSTAYEKQHRDELGEAMVLNLESLGQPGTLRAVTGELMGRVSHSRDAVGLLERAGEAAGTPVTRRYLTGGMTDAASFSRKGIAAATLIRLDEANYFEHYHTPGDDVPAIREELLDEALEVLLESVRILDREAAAL